MIKKLILRVLLMLMGIVSVNTTFAQSTKFLTEKPGKFVFGNYLNKCPGVDYNLLTNNLSTITEWIHLNDSIVNTPIGFEAGVKLSGNLCDKMKKMEEYGIQSLINISFRFFYLENGVSITASDWAAHDVEFLINNPINLISTQFDEAEFQTDDPQQLKQPLEKALANLKRYYTTAPVINEITPGVRLYASDTGTWFKGSLLVVNPDQPEIWIPVTVKEIMEAKLDYYKVKKEIDRINMEKNLEAWTKMNFKPDPGQLPTTTVYDEIKKEFENFTAEELGSPAYSCADCGISMINARSEGRAVVRFNPVCWDRTLPSTAVQFISMNYRPATNEEMGEFILNNNGLTDYVGLFNNNLPIEKMGVLIQQK